MRAEEDKKIKVVKKLRTCTSNPLSQRILWQHLPYPGSDPLFWFLPVRWGMATDGTRIPVEHSSLVKCYERLGLNLPPEMEKKNKNDNDATMKTAHRAR